MLLLIIFKISDHCCTSQGDPYPFLKEIQTFETKQDLYNYFDTKFEISHPNNHEIYIKAFKKAFEKNMNHGFVDDTDTFECKNCRTMYIYGESDKIKNLEISSYELVGIYSLKKYLRHYWKSDDSIEEYYESDDVYETHYKIN
jgi:RNase P subunit RPR2